MHDRGSHDVVVLVRIEGLLRGGDGDSADRGLLTMVKKANSPTSSDAELVAQCVRSIGRGVLRGDAEDAVDDAFVSRFARRYLDFVG